METIIAAFIILCLSFIGLGVSVLFFGKTAKKEACGKVPELDTEECPSQKAGICPFEDDSGALKMQRHTKLSYSKLGKR
ncbi:hypothetical protein DID78_04605 [Candidatus Marinamargulisbacteria bacterium SCGC AG-343-D04]|nr:hypothetical protein DID78_04605 [Candidatus Marinamargulisbacteria bacterium SCGC AG-343-D04]